jgi:hypothetical protein
LQEPSQNSDNETTEEHALNGGERKAHVFTEEPMILEDSQERWSITCMFAAPTLRS